MITKTRVIAACALILFTATACNGEAVSSGGKVVVKEAPGWIMDARSFLSTSHVGSDFGELTGTGARSKVTTLIDEAPKQSLTSEQSQALASLRAMQDFYVAVDDAGTVAAARYAAADSAVPDIASASSRVQLVQSAQDQLVKHGEDLLKDITCDVAWGMMMPQEQTTVNNEVTNNGYVRVVPQEIPGLEDMTREAAIGAIQSVAKANFLKLFASADAVNWYTYGSSLYDKAQEVTSDGSTVISSPNGSLSRALVYYAKICLAPPTR